jgi:hypothetical protein
LLEFPRPLERIHVTVALDASEYAQRFLCRLGVIVRPEKPQATPAEFVDEPTKGFAARPIGPEHVPIIPASRARNHRGTGLRSVDGSNTRTDALAGVQIGTPEHGKRWHAEVYTEIGYDVLTPGPMLGFEIRLSGLRPGIMEGDSDGCYLQTAAGDIPKWANQGRF